MYGKVKLTKRQIKEDKFTGFMLQSKQQVMENWQYLLIGVAVVILLVVALSYYLDSQKLIEIEAEKNYAQAVVEYRSGNVQLALVTLNQLIADHSGTAIAPKAILLLGRVNLENKNYAEAVRFFTTFTDKYKEDKLSLAAAYAGLGVAFENQAQYDQAALQFKAAANTYPEGPSVGDYNYSLLRNYLLAGMIDEATVVKDQIAKDFPKTELERNALLLYFEKATQ